MSAEALYRSMGLQGYEVEDTWEGRSCSAILRHDRHAPAGVAKTVCRLFTINNGFRTSSKLS